MLIPHHFMSLRHVFLSNSEWVSFLRGVQQQTSSIFHLDELCRQGPQLLEVKMSQPMVPQWLGVNFSILFPQLIGKSREGTSPITAMVKRKLQEEDALPPDDLEVWASHPRLLRHVRCLVASKDPLLGSGLEMIDLPSGND